MNKFNCKQFNTRLKIIKTKKDDFDSEFRKGDVQACLEIKNNLLDLVQEFKDSFWPFEEEELSQEKLGEFYDQYASVFEKTGIVKHGQITQELLPKELKNEVFKMPSKSEFLDYIASKEVRMKEMFDLGLVEPVLVPIAADFGKDIDNDKSIHSFHNYTGLLKILAEEIRSLGKSKKIKSSGGQYLSEKEDLNHNQVNLNHPISVDDEFNSMMYTFLGEDGTYKEDLDQKQFIEEHKDAASSFPGFGIYFKEKGVLPKNRKADSPLYAMSANRKPSDYISSLNFLDISGTTAHTELILLLYSLQESGRVTRDYGIEEDMETVIGGNTFKDSQKIGHCGWNSDFGKSNFLTVPTDRNYPGTACAPIGELI